jgi:hypothetical protein
MELISRDRWPYFMQVEQLRLQILTQEERKSLADERTVSED